MQITIKQLGEDRMGKGKNVKSTDPRKAAIVAAFKDRIADVTKVTCVSETRPGVFSANCMNATTGTCHGVFEIEGLTF